MRVCCVFRAERFDELSVHIGRVECMMHTCSASRDRGESASLRTAWNASVVCAEPSDSMSGQCILGVASASCIRAARVGTEGSQYR